MTAAHVPEDVGFATKPQIARRMIAGAITAKIPFSFVAADSVYGTGEIEIVLCKAGKGYVLGVAANHVFRSWGKKQLVGGTAAKIAQNLPKGAWLRLHDWAYLELADLDAGEYNSTFAGEWTRGLLIRRNIADGDLAFFSTWCPKGTPMKKLVLVEGHRWAIEDSFETAKNEFGLDHNETRSWHGWHRHVSLVMLAFAMMAVIRHRANTVPPKKTMARRTKHRC
jgi:SRSO17 transposase